MADKKQKQSMKSIVEYDGVNYKKQYVNEETGAIKTVTYVKKPGTKTTNEILTENMEENLKIWKNSSLEVITDNWQKRLKKWRGYYCRYQAVNKHGKDKGKLCLRNGGFIGDAEPDFLCLASPFGSWSLQYADARQIFIIKTPPRGRPKKVKAPAQLKKAQQEVLAKLDAKADAKDKKNEKVKPKKAAKRNKLPPKLTDEEADELLKKAYYEEDMKFGRDKLYQTLKDDGHRITRKQVDEWLKKQVLYQLDNQVFSNTDVLDWVDDIYNELGNFAEVLWEKNPDLHSVFEDKAPLKRMRSFLSTYTQNIENQLLKVAFDFFVKKKVIKQDRSGRYNCVLCFDGIMVLKDNIANVDDLLGELELYVKKETCFNIHFTTKPMDEGNTIHEIEKNIPSDDEFLKDSEIVLPNMDEEFSIKGCVEKFKPLLSRPSLHYAKLKEYLEYGSLQLAQVGTSVCCVFNGKVCIEPLSAIERTFVCIPSGNGTPFITHWNKDPNNRFHHSI